MSKREPVGVVMVIAPWNYPYLTAVNTIVPALIAGNAVILKHAAQTLLVGERFAEAFRRAGLPKGLFQNLVLSHEQTEKLIGSGKIDHVNFTGSVAGGRAIERAAAGTFASLGLELGGKDPAYVLRRRQARSCRRESGRRRLLQFRPVLLRHRAHLCRTRRSMTISSRASPISPGNMSSAIRSTRRPRSGRWRAARFADHGARPDRRGAAQGRDGA